MQLSPHCSRTEFTHQPRSPPRVPGIVADRPAYRPGPRRLVAAGVEGVPPLPSVASEQLHTLLPDMPGLSGLGSFGCVRGKS